MTKFRRLLSVTIAAALTVAAAIIAACLINGATVSAFAETVQQHNTWKVVPNITRWTYGEYDPEVNVPEAEPTYGSKDDVVFTFYKTVNGVIDESSEVSSLDEFRVPTDSNRIPAGRYAMRAVLEKTAEYTELHGEVYFNVFLATNRWAQGVNIARWTESETPSLPEGRPQFGRANFLIYNEDGSELFYRDVRGIIYDKREEMTAGWYKLQAYVEETSNYTGIALYEYRFRVFPASVNSWKVLPNIQGWTVGEEPCVPVGSPLHTDGNPVVFTYKKLGEADETATTVVPNQAGEYVMIATATAEGYADLVAEIAFTIKSASTDLVNEWTVLPHIDGWFVGEEPNAPVGSAKAGLVSFVYKKADGTILDAAPTQAGEYVMVVTAIADSYRDLTAEVKFTVKKPDEVEVLPSVNGWKVAPNIQGWIVGNKASNPVGEANAGDVVFTYKTADGTALTEKPSEAGRYVMVATVEEDGYLPLVAEISFSISRPEEDDNSMWITGIAVLGTLVVVLAAGCIVFISALRKYGLGIKAAFSKSNVKSSANTNVNPNVNPNAYQNVYSNVDPNAYQNFYPNEDGQDDLK